ncbi:hypothetical protein F750_4935 [Streptomyces sp. PAMC 26508]|nr:hypothetical protein F750_4935 [Streptomyces sp. PAMC 26508]
MRGGGNRPAGGASTVRRRQPAVTGGQPTGASFRSRNQ